MQTEQQRAQAQQGEDSMISAAQAAPWAGVEEHGAPACEHGVEHR
jgi:hypothetical protein